MEPKQITSPVDRLILSSSPHLKDTESVSKIMWNVNLALLPAVIFSVFNFGLPALRTILVSIVGAVVSEALIQVFRKKPVTILDGSAFLTGLLLAMCLPPNISWIMTLFGSVTAIAIAKHMFGGLGHNIFNPAHVGRAIMMISYPVAMTTWSASLLRHPVAIDAITTATPLGMLKLQGYQKVIEFFGSKTELYHALLMGTRAGSIGETSTVLLLIGGIYLIIRGYVKWQLPATMILTVGLLTWVFGGKSGLFTGDPIFHMMAGGLIIGAFFMATDMVTTPITVKGQILFAAGAGGLTALIRLVGGYPEGVCYSILLMNALTPMIDRYLPPKLFGADMYKNKGDHDVHGR